MRVDMQKERTHDKLAWEMKYGMNYINYME